MTRPPITLPDYPPSIYMQASHDMLERIADYTTAAVLADRAAIEAASRGTGDADNLLALIVKEMDDGRDAPGHSHDVAGVWDDNSSNGHRRGQPCAWCAIWNEARAHLAARDAAQGAD